MTQALLHARRKLFGPSTEASVMEGQTTLFDDMQSLASELLKSKKELTVKSYTRTARKPGVRQEMLAGLPTEIEEYIINPEEKCEACENINATFFHYSRSRSGDVPKKLLTDFSGYLTTDAYNLDSRINMTRLVPQLRVLHISQPA